MSKTIDAVKGDKAKRTTGPANSEPDDVVAQTGDNGKIELSESELDTVSGGVASIKGPLKFEIED